MAQWTRERRNLWIWWIVLSLLSVVVVGLYTIGFIGAAAIDASLNDPRW